MSTPFVSFTPKPVYIVGGQDQGQERNVGWRIDYVFVTQEMLDSVKDAFSDVTGSDDCPVGRQLANT